MRSTTASSRRTRRKPSDALSTPAPTPEEIAGAARSLREGGMVAFPTETVYGLGADAGNADAVRRVFEIKDRPPTNPVIVHVGGVAMARRIVSTWSDAAERLAGAFWPGPLTLVLPVAPGMPDEVTAGGPTVGVRAPDHPVALALLREASIPLVGPSANRSGSVSPTSAAHVREAFGDAVTVLDGGPCRAGIESTVLDLVAPVPTVLRPGVTGREAIAAALGTPVGERAAGAAAGPERSPGRHGAHYRPAARVELLDVGHDRDLPEDAVLLRFGEALGPDEISMPTEPVAFAARLYAALREADRPGVAVIALEVPPESSATDDASRAARHAVLERLHRAAMPD